MADEGEEGARLLIQFTQGLFVPLAKDVVRMAGRALFTGGRSSAGLVPAVLGAAANAVPGMGEYGWVSQGAMRKSLAGQETRFANLPNITRPDLVRLSQECRKVGMRFSVGHDLDGNYEIMFSARDESKLDHALNRIHQKYLGATIEEACGAAFPALPAAGQSTSAGEATVESPARRDPLPLPEVGATTPDGGFVELPAAGLTTPDGAGPVHCTGTTWDAPGEHVKVPKQAQELAAIPGNRIWCAPAEHGLTPFIVAEPSGTRFWVADGANGSVAMNPQTGVPLAGVCPTPEIAANQAVAQTHAAVSATVVNDKSIIASLKRENDAIPSQARVTKATAKAAGIQKGHTHRHAIKRPGARGR